MQANFTTSLFTTNRVASRANWAVLFAGPLGLFVAAVFPFCHDIINNSSQFADTELVLFYFIIQYEKGVTLWLFSSLEVYSLRQCLFSFWTFFILSYRGIIMASPEIMHSQQDCIIATNIYKSEGWRQSLASWLKIEITLSEIYSGAGGHWAKHHCHGHRNILEKQQNLI